MDYNDPSVEYTTTTAVNGGIDAITMIVFLAALAVSAVGLWLVFRKAGRPGWTSLIPFYNGYVLLKIAGRPGWWLLLLLIPLVNVVITLIVSLDLAKAFGKSTVFGVVGLWLFSVVGFLMLGFGKATYQGPVVEGNSPAPTSTPPASVE